MQRLNHETFEAQARALLPAIAYGDAAGLPVETRSAEAIAARYGKIDHLLPTNEHELFKTATQPGFWSDDTQLSIAVMQGLIQANGFDLETMAQTHLDMYDDTELVDYKGQLIPRGWGKSTIAAMENLRHNIPPTESGYKNGGGNGILMKLAPLAFWQIAQKTPLEARYEEYDQLTTMTHDSDIARLTTRVHGDILGYLLTHTYSKAGFLEALDQSLVLHEQEVGEAAQELREDVMYLNGEVTRSRILDKTDAKGFYAPQTLAMVYGAFIARNGDFRTSIYEAVNLGGDTDSTASIVAAMSVFKEKNTLRMPLDYLNIDRLDELKYISRRFGKAALKS